jgi:hypothetical protein
LEPVLFTAYFAEDETSMMFIAAAQTLALESQATALPICR